MNPVQTLLVVGGPLHGNWVAVDTSRGEGSHIILPETPPLMSFSYASDPRFADPLITIHDYIVRSLWGVTVLVPAYE
jgi:hypothetical protein